MNNDFRRLIFVFFVIFIVFVSGFSVFAQDPEIKTGTSYQPVRSVDLGVTSLTLEPGETYTFSVSFEPEDPPVTRLTWFNTDNTVIAVNQLTNTVTALTPGTAKVMAESFDKEAYVVCEITVSGTQEKDLSGMVEGKALLTLSEEDRAKIKASQINRYLDLLEMSVFNEETLQKLQNRTMDVMAKVHPGTEEAESELALALGMTRAYPMKHLHLVSLYGTLSQILEFVKDNEDLIRIFKGHDIYIFDPRPESDASPLLSKDTQGTDTTMLQGHVEELTSVSTIHKLGYTGKGVTLAIVDTGLNSSHEQYNGRVIAENCFSYSWHCKRIPGCVPCDENDKDCDPEKCYDCDNNPISACEGGSVENYGETYSAFPGGAVKLNEFNHGSHVAGISAGKDGMAPGANIVAVEVQSEYYFPKNISDDNPDGYGVTLFNHDIYAGYDWLLEIQDELKKEGKPISILNLSLGGGQHADYCDNDDDCAEEYEYFRDLNAAGILPAAASGNEFLDDAVASPGCLSDSLTVGALADMEKPYISCYSNHNPVVDILAPGTQLRSAYLVDNDGKPGTNTYGQMSGTSMATPVVSGALALIMEAFPGKTIEEYKAILVEMSTRTADRRNSNNQKNLNFTTDDGTGTVFPFTKPVLDFSNFQDPKSETKTVMINDTSGEVNMYTGIKTKNSEAAIIADMDKEKAKVIVSGDVTAAGRDANGVVAYAASGESEFALSVTGNIIADNAAIVIDEKSRGNIDILVTEKIAGRNVGILIDDNVITKEVSGNTPLSNVTITAYEIDPKDNVVKFKNGNRTAEKALEKSINYIIRMDQPENGGLTAVTEQGESWLKLNHGYKTANPGETVYFALIPVKSEDFDPEGYDFQVFDKKTGRRLPKTADGLFFTTVRNGGPVHVFAKAFPKPEPQEPQRSIEFYRIADFFDHHEMPKTGFSALKPQSLSVQPLNVNYTPTRLTLQLPTLDVEAKIVTVPDIDGAYPVEWLGNAVGMLEGSNMPGEGITVLTGHNHLNTTEAGPFALLRELETGDSFMITDSRGTMQTWHVYRNAKIPAGGFSRIAGDVKDNALLLITCEDESPDGGYLNRRVVLAEKQ